MPRAPEPNHHVQLMPSSGAGNASGDRQLPARLRRLLDRLDEAAQVNGGVERRQAPLPAPDRLDEQGIHLPDVEQIAAGEVGRDIEEALGDSQLAQRVAAPGAEQPEPLATLRGDGPGGDQRAFPPVALSN